MGTRLAGTKPRRTHKATLLPLEGDLGVIQREMKRHRRKVHKNLKPFKPYPRRHAVPADDRAAIVLEKWDADKARYIVLACKINDDHLHESGTGLHLDANALYRQLQSQRTPNPELRVANLPQIPAHSLKYIAACVVQYYIASRQQPTREHRRYTTPPDPATIPLYFDKAHQDGDGIVLAFGIAVTAPDDDQGVLHYNAVRFRSIRLFWNERWEMIVTYRHFPKDHSPMAKQQRKGARKIEAALLMLQRMEWTMRQNGISRIKNAELAQLLGLSATALGNTVRVVHRRTTVRIDGSARHGYSLKSIDAAIQSERERMDQAARRIDPKAVAKQADKLRRRTAPVISDDNGDGEWQAPHIVYDPEPVEEYD